MTDASFGQQRTTMGRMAMGKRERDRQPRALNSHFGERVDRVRVKTSLVRAALLYQSRRSSRSTIAAASSSSRRWIRLNRAACSFRMERAACTNPTARQTVSSTSAATMASRTPTSTKAFDNEISERSFPYARASSTICATTLDRRLLKAILCAVFRSEEDKPCRHGGPCHHYPSVAAHGLKTAQQERRNATTPVSPIPTNTHCASVLNRYVRIRDRPRRLRHN